MQVIYQNEDEGSNSGRGGLLKYETAREFLADIKKEFEGKDEEEVKVA